MYSSVLVCNFIIIKIVNRILKIFVFIIFHLEKSSSVAVLEGNNLQ